MMKRSCFTSIIVAFVFLLALGESAPADLLNGGFAEDFTGNTDPMLGWVVTTDSTAGPVAWSAVDQAAFFKQDPDEDDTLTDSTLSQLITVDPEFPVLSFDVLMTTFDPGETDEVTASLGGVELYTLSATTPPSGGASSFEEMVTRYLPHYGITPGSYILEFKLTHDYDDGPTIVRLDNVALVPVPGAVVLGSIGLGLAGCWLGKRQTL